MNNLFNKNRLPQVQDFLNHLSDEWFEITAKQLKYRFFNNSRSFTRQAINVLEENNIIEVDRSEPSYVNGKWVVNRNRYRLAKAKSTKVAVKKLATIKEEEFFSEPVEDKDTYIFKYRGIREVSAHITNEDKIFAKQCRIKLGDMFSEYNFAVECLDKDWSEEKIWYLYNKLVNKYPLKQIEDGTFQ